MIANTIELFGICSFNDYGFNDLRFLSEMINRDREIHRADGEIMRYV